MDLLASLGLGTALPEQATRLTCHPGIIRLLDGSGSSNEKAEENVRLGFHQCLNCGIQLEKSSPSSGASNKNKKNNEGVPTGVACQGCHRVLYCSAKCRTDDATPINNNNNTDTTGEENTESYGHSPIICSLLRLCNDDEDAEDEELLQLHNSKNNSNNNNTERKEAAIYRNQTERESYPATLFNILSEGPTWFVEAMTRRARQAVDVKSPIRSPVPITSAKNSNSSRRGKRDRTTAFGNSGNEESQKRQNSSATTTEIVLHIVGATTESELWGWDGSSSSSSNSSSSSVDVLDAYTEASTNLITYLEELLQVPSITLRCIFIGPNCGNSSRNSSSAMKIPITTAMNYDTSSLSMKKKSSITATKSSMLIIETQCCNYGSSKISSSSNNNNTKELLLPPPDVIIFFNPGFSCPDYHWSSALSYASCLSICDNVGGGPIPFLVTTNTELEGYADIKVLLDGGYINISTVSRGILEAIDYPIDNSNCNNNKHYEDEFEEQCIFGMNPYVGLRVRQSGTMGNDLFVKNRWIICGLFQKTSIIHPSTTTPPTRNKLKEHVRKSNKSITDSRNKDDDDDDDDDDDIGEEKSRKRQRQENVVGGGDKNAKKKNPALI